MSFPRPTSSTSLHRWMAGAVLVVLLLWVLFFDSHSLLKRYKWHQELETLTEENTELRRNIEHLQEQLDKPLSDQDVERIAREEYGMKRPGETVYLVNPD